MKKLFKRIESYLLILKIVAMLTKAFRKGIKDVLIRESKEESYLPQSDFESCLARAKAGIYEAIKKPIYMLAIAIAAHRKKFHNEDHSKEVKTVSKSLSATDEKVAVKAATWWRG